MSKKEERRRYIKASARERFIESGIELTTFAQIAKGAKVGEATVYRHYSNKGELALEIAMDYGEGFVNAVTRRLEDHDGSHLQKLELILAYYIELFQEQPDYFIYLEHFDNYMMHNDLQPKGLETYEALFLGINKMICDIQGGEVPDSSVRNDMNVDLAAHTFNISFLSLCQKLLLRGQVLHEDIRHNPIEALVLLKETMINSIKNPSFDG